MRKDRGFTLIELLIVVAIIGIIAAIAIPNLLNAINRGRQKRSMADMRTLGTATEAYGVDVGFYPTQSEEDLPNSDMINYLQPTYVARAPRNDGWRTAFRCMSERRFYSFLSKGRDAEQEAAMNSDLYNRNPTTDLDCDIVYSNGTFMSYPEGIQTD